MKLRYLLKKSLNIKTTYMIILILALILVVGGYFSYALFTTSSESKGALNIVTGNLYSLIESDSLDSNKSIVLTPGSDKTITLELKNVNGINSKHNLYYETTSNNIKIGYTTDGDVPPTNTGYVLPKNGTNGDTKTIKVRMKNKDSGNITVTFGTDAGLPNAELAFPQGKLPLSQYVVEYDQQKLLEKNPNILAVYRYNENGTGTGLAYTGCLGGEEAGCVDVINEINASTEYNVGDVIKYQVNDTEVKYFNVLYDNDKDTDENNNGTLTLQQRENTVYSKAWYSTPIDGSGYNNNTKGAVELLDELEKSTKTWTNVNNQTYTLGETVFGTGDFATANTACTRTDSATINAELCNEHKYQTFTRSNVKARIITAQEAGEMHCKIDKLNDTSSYMTCMKFMYNYLKSSTTYGGSVDDNTHDDGAVHNYGYWTSSSNLITNSSALTVRTYGSVADDVTSSKINGARAVVNINKNNRVEIFNN